MHGNVCACHDVMCDSYLMCCYYKLFTLHTKGPVRSTKINIQHLFVYYKHLNLQVCCAESGFNQIVIVEGPKKDRLCERCFKNMIIL